MSAASADEPTPPRPDWPRYSARPFPPYRHLPGHSPHPVRDPRGHSYGQHADAAPLEPERWEACEDWRYAVDLHNFAYWWECHEVLEGLWRAGDRASDTGRVLHGLIQVAAANLKRHLGEEKGARSLASRGVGKLAIGPQRLLGMDVHRFAADVIDSFEGVRPIPALISLEVTCSRSD